MVTDASETLISGSNEAALADATMEDADELRQKLLQKSIDAHVLALETINRLSIKYRIDAFCILLCNSWELLLKAKILQDTENIDSIYYPTSPEKRPRTLSLFDALQRCIAREDDPVRRNLERTEELRHEAMHLAIKELPADIMELLQSTVINYHEKIRQWFDKSLRDFVPEGMMWIVIDPSHLRRDLALIKESLGPREIKYLTELQAEIRREARELEFSTEFVSVVNVTVGVANRPSGGDVRLQGGTDGDPTRVIYKPRDPSETHPLYQKDAISMINKACPLLGNLNDYEFQAICHVINAKSRPDWHYKQNMGGSRSQFSHELVEHIVARLTNDSGFLDRATSAYTGWKRDQGHFIRKSRRA